MDIVFNKRTKLVPIGFKTGQLTVLKFLNKKERAGEWLYLCVCSCGKELELSRSKLCSKNKQQSCGCITIKRLQKEPGEVSFGVLFCSYKARARKDKLSFELTYEQFKEIVQKDCIYDGRPPKDYNTYVDDGHKSNAIQKPSVDRAWIKANGIDRVDPDKGYTIDNCMPCCAQCNYAKSDYTLTEFLDHNVRMYEFQKKKKDGYI